eukprot:SAG22_NODE_3726_length_1558_cov_1.088417_3_plen_87_part_00
MEFGHLRLIAALAATALLGFDQLVKRSHELQLVGAAAVAALSIFDITTWLSASGTETATGAGVAAGRSTPKKGDRASQDDDLQSPV